MTLRNSLTFIKLTAVVFVSTTIVFGVKYFESQSKNKILKQSIVLDKKTYANDLKEIFNRYDNEILINKNLLSSKHNNSQTETVVVPNISYEQKVKVVYKNSESKSYLFKIDSLNNLLKNQSENITSLTNQVTILNGKNKELQKENSTNEGILSVSKNLTATNVFANGIKILSNNIIETKRFSNTEQIKVCFTLLENRAAVKGNKDIYIQIVNPNNKIVNKNGESFKSGDRLLNFSAKTNVFYDNEELDVCVFVDPNKTDMSKGDYEINIFSGINLIGNTVFSLK
jgi:hypothetical protein